MYQLAEVYLCNFTLFKLPAVCNRPSLLGSDIALIVIGVLTLVVGIIMVITGTGISYARKSESVMFSRDLH